MDYAKRAQQIFGVHICTYNLHTLACRGYKQELARGPASREKEFWLERKIQELKQRVKYRAKANAEAVLVNDLMVSLALDRLSAQDNDLGTVDELLERCTPTTERRQAPASSPLRGLLPRLQTSAWIELRHCLAIAWENYYKNDDSQWTHEDVAIANVEQYKRCIIVKNGRETIFSSAAYRRSMVSVSHYVHVAYDFQGNICHHVAKIKKFLLLKTPSFATALENLPVALVDLYDASFTKDGRYNLTRLLMVEDLGHPQFSDYPVKVTDIQETLIACLPNNSRKGYFILDDPDEDV